MLSIKKVILTVQILLTVFGCAMGATGMRITHEGRALADIVVAPDAPEDQQHAAEELARFLNQISNANLQIVPDLKSSRHKRHILVGVQAVQSVDPDFSPRGLGQEGIVIRTVGDNLILAGGSQRGTLYAVYTFLETHLGCRWWTSTVSTIPRAPTIELGEISVQYVPPLEYREPFWFDAHDADWAVRNKSNGNSVRCDAKRGGKHRYEGFVHSFNSLIPPDKYSQEHPEWFSEIEGKRVSKRSQLCLANEAMQAELIKNLKQRLRANPSATIASVSQNDWHNYCTCDACKAVDQEEGSPAGTMIRFVNAVAAAIEKEFPHVAISTLAYQYTRKPPKITKPRHNVIVRLCSIECSFAVPLSHERNKAFRDDIVGWSKICNRLYIWDYVTNFRHHILPHPNLRVLGPNVRFFVDHSVKGIFEQGAYTTHGAEMAELRAWVLAKLLWNPSLDAEVLIDEFLTGYFGGAGLHIKAYLNLTHDAATRANDKLGCFADIALSNVKVSWPTSDRSRFIDLETLSQSLNHFSEAEAAVQDDDELLFRVKCAKLPIQYAFMMCWNPLREQARKTNATWPLPDDIQPVYDEFVRVARKNNVSRLDEWNEGYGNLEKALRKAEE